MLARLLSYLAFAVLMTLSIAGSAIIVVFLYIPMVVLKAVVQAATGKAKSTSDASAGSRSSGPANAAS